MAGRKPKPTAVKKLEGDIVVCIRDSLGKHGRYPFEKGAIASSLVICRQYFCDDEGWSFLWK
jgi:type I restriction enzyme S subunit